MPKTEDIPDFQVDSLQLLDQGKRQLRKGKLNEDYLSQEIEDFRQRYGKHFTNLTHLARTINLGHKSKEKKTWPVIYNTALEVG